MLRLFGRIVFVCTALQASAIPAADLPRIAVFDFKSMGIDDQQVELLMEQILAAVDATGKYRSIGRSDLETMLGMEKLKEELSGDCDTSCMAQIAGAIGARYVLAGYIARDELGFTLIIKMIDQSKARVIKRINRRIKGEHSELDWALSGIVRDVLGLADSSTQPDAAARTGGTGFLDVSVKPKGAAGAEILLDGVRRPERAPATLRDIPSGEYALVLRKPLFADWKKSVVVRKDGVERVRATMKPNFGPLEINSHPRGAIVFIDGREAGTTPYFAAKIDARTYRIRLTKDQYREYEEAHAVKPHVGTRINISLKPAFGSLEIDSGGVRNADVFLDGTMRCKTPCTLTNLPSRKYDVRVVKAQHGEQHRKVRIRDGATERLSIRLGSGHASVTITTKPKGAGVIIGGEEVGTTSPSLELDFPQSGRYELVLKYPGHRDHEEVLEIASGQHRRIHRELVRETASAVPGSGGELVVTARDKTGNAVDANVWINGQEVGTTPHSSHHDPGEYVVRVESKFGVRTEIVVLRRSKRVSFTARFDSGISSGNVGGGSGFPSWAPWTTLVLGITSAAAGGLCLGLAANDQSAMDNEFKGSPAWNDLKDSHEQKSTAGYVMFSLAGVSAIVTVVLFVVRDGDDDGSKPSAYLTPMRGGGILSMGASF